MIAGAVEADLRRHRVEKIQHEEYSKRQADDPRPGRPWEHRTVPGTPSKRHNPSSREDARICEPERAEQKYDRTEDGSAGDEPDCNIAFDIAQQNAAERRADRRGEDRAEQDCEGLQAPDCSAGSDS